MVQTVKITVVSAGAVLGRVTRPSWFNDGRLGRDSEKTWKFHSSRSSTSSRHFREVPQTLHEHGLEELKNGFLAAFCCIFRTPSRWTWVPIFSAGVLRPGNSAPESDSQVSGLRSLLSAVPNKSQSLSTETFV